MKAFKQFMKAHLVTIVLVLILVVGLSLLLYPTFSEWWNSFHQTRAIAGYKEAVENLDEESYAQILADAKAYNEKLAQKGTSWILSDEEMEEYESLLNLAGNGVMGVISIPAIDVELPIYHDTQKEILQVAVGHIPGSSLPVGGESSHCVLSGHRGLTSARLFTDLDKVAEGDTFTLTVLKEVLTYEVDQILIVEPDDTSALRIEQNKDYCTLVTCTPYGINSHRLLIRGHRVETVEERVVSREATQIEPVYVAMVIGGFLIVLLAVGALVRSGLRSRRYKKAALDEKSKKEEKKET